MELLLISLSVLVFSISFFILVYSSMWILNEVKKYAKTPTENYSQGTDSRMLSDFDVDDYSSEFTRNYDARIEKMKRDLAEENIKFNNENSEIISASNGLYIIDDNEFDHQLQTMLSEIDEVSK